MKRIIAVLIIIATLLLNGCNGKSSNNISDVSSSGTTELKATTSYANSEPVTATTVEPITTTTHEPITSTASEPVTATTLEPVTTTASEPVTTNTSEPVTATTLEPATTTTHEPVTTTSEPFTSQSTSSEGTSPAQTSATVPTNNTDIPFLNGDLYDAFILCKDANFNTELADGVYWVPINTLGEPEYTNYEIIEIIKTNDPQVIKSKIHTLFDAVKYHYFSGFKVLKKGEHKDYYFDGVLWQHHKSGEEAVRTNQGDCSGNAALVRYLLENDYDEEGYITFNLSGGSGHVFNYFKDEDKYYFIDFSNIHSARSEQLANKLQPSYPNIGNLFQADSIEKFVKYFGSRYVRNAVFTTYIADRVVPIGYKNGSYYLPDDYDVKVYGNVDGVSIIFSQRPDQVPEWDAYPRNFKIVTSDIVISPSAVYSDYSTDIIKFNIKIFLISGQSVEINKFNINYYNESSELLKSEAFTEDDLNKYLSNNHVFDSMQLPAEMAYGATSIDGEIEFRDPWGNSSERTFEYEAW